MEFRELLLGLVLVWLAAKVAGEGMERIGQTAVLGELLGLESNLDDLLRAGLQATLVAPPWLKALYNGTSHALR